MKKNALFGSIALSIALSVFAMWIVARSGRQSTEPGALGLQAQPPVNAIDSAALVPSQNRFVWSELESTNYLEYVTNLKKVQCPWPTICDLIIGEVNRLYAPRIAAVQRSASPPYWKSRSFMDVRHDPAIQGRLRALKQEKRSLIKEILNVDIEDLEEKLSGEVPAGEEMDFLPQEKRSLILSLRQSAYDRRNAIIKTVRDGRLLPSDEAEMKRITEEFNTQLPALLTKEEYFEYQMRFSERSERLRRNQEFFNADETEFRGIFEIVEEYDKNFARSESQAERETACKVLSAKLEERLGPERYKEYLRADDPDYGVLSQIGARYGLPKESLVDAYNVRKELMTRYVEIISKATPDTRANYSKAMEQEARQKLIAIMGEQAFRDYLPIENYIFRK